MKKLSDWVKESKKNKKKKPSDFVTRFEPVGDSKSNQTDNGDSISSETIQSNNSNSNQQQQDTPSNSDSILPSLKTTLDSIKETIGKSTDIVFREFEFGQNGEFKAAVVFTDGLAQKYFLNDSVIKPLMVDIREANSNITFSHSTDILTLLKNHTLSTAEVSKAKTMTEIYDALLVGESIFLVDGLKEAAVIGTRHWEGRGVQEPSSQTVVRGPKDGFSETLRINTALLRRRIKDPSLWIESFYVGKKTKTEVAIVYLKGVATESVLKEVRKRIKRIDVDSILESGQLEELIQDETYTPFPTVYNSERPDGIAGGILEGRVAIIVDGTPFVLLVPALFVQFLQSPEDYYQRSDIASLIRMLRFISFLLALLVPSAYIAVTTFHQEMLPTTLLVSLASQREGSPFPAFVEALLMEVTFEILREAGIRLPRAVGSAISIVGALVLGQAAVEAGLVSAAMVIVVSLTAISSFVIPQYNMSISIRMLRFGFMFLAASFGLLGIIVGIIILVLHMCSLRSFGIPYLSPMGPFNAAGQQDAIIRLPQWKLFSRPRLIGQKDKHREETPAPSPNINMDENKEN